MSTPTPKTLCTGAHTPPADKTKVDREATLAALQGVPLYVACPYAEGTEAATHFAAVWLLVRQADVPLHPRPPAALLNDQTARHGPGQANTFAAWSDANFSLI